MWTTENRPRYDRTGLRYPSDLTDAGWALVEPLLPSAKRGGRRREVVVRDVLNGVVYILSTACRWRALPKDLPPRSTVHRYFQRWDYDGTLMKIHDALYVACREQAEREVTPTACVIERSFAWFGRCRRLAKDFENLNRTALAFLRLASIRLMLRRLCKAA